MRPDSNLLLISPSRGFKINHNDIVGREETFNNPKPARGFR